MAINATELFRRHTESHRLSAAQCEATFGAATYVRTVDESRSLNGDAMPKVIVSASGMATGGRVLHHLRIYAPHERNTILFAGFQAGGTRGAAMVNGAERIRIFGEYVPVRAEVRNLAMLSGHADRDELLRWLRGFRRPPRRVFIVHGEPESSEALRIAIRDELGWDCEIPAMFDEARL